MIQVGTAGLKVHKNIAKRKNKNYIISKLRSSDGQCKKCFSPFGRSLHKHEQCEYSISLSDAKRREVCSYFMWNDSLFVDTLWFSDYHSDKWIFTHRGISTKRDLGMLSGILWAEKSHCFHQCFDALSLSFLCGISSNYVRALVMD